MSTELIMGIYGLDGDEKKTELMDSLYKYSGILDIDISPGNTQIRVRYDKNNILAGDIKETIEEGGFKVGYIRV